MRRATLGNALNYATTLLAQILFARRFGASSQAAAYVIAFGIVTAASGIFVTNIQNIALPRLLNERGFLRAGAARLLLRVSALGALVAAGLFLSSAPLGRLLELRAGLSHTPIQQLLQLATIALLLQVLSGAAASLSLARGHRFLPALAPALPSVAVAVLLIAVPVASVTDVFIAFSFGSLCQLSGLVALSLPSIRLVKEDVGRVNHIVAASFASTTLLSLIAPLERVMAATHAAGDAARYDYAARSLTAVLSIVLGGVVLAGLGAWSRLAVLGRMEELKHSLTRVCVTVTAVLLVLAAIAALATNSLVAIVYQHGAFTARDTATVSTLIRISLPGFLAQGISLVFTSALSAVRANRYVIAAGVTTFLLRSSLIVGLSLHWYAAGVAAAYSISAVTVTSGLFLITIRKGFWSPLNLSVFKQRGG